MATEKIVIENQRIVEVDDSVEAMTGKRPWIKASIAGLIFGVVWRNIVTREDGSTFVSPSFEVYRRYRGKNGQWKTVHTGSTNDAPRFALAWRTLFETVVLLGVDIDEAQSGEQGE